MKAAFLLALNDAIYLNDYDRDIEYEGQTYQADPLAGTDSRDQRRRQSCPSWASKSFASARIYTSYCRPTPAPSPAR